MRDPRTLAATSFNRVRVPGLKCMYVRGLLEPIENDFFANAHAERTRLPAPKPKAHYKKGVPRGRPPSTALGVPKSSVRKGNHSRSNLAALKRGRFVHKQLEKIINGQPVGILHPYTASIRDVMARKGLVPVASEVPLVSKRGVYYTKLDILCQRRKEYHVVSIKTGYGPDISTWKTRCDNECFKLRRSVVNQHNMQIACEMYCLRREYGLNVKSGIIIYAGFGPQRSVTTLDCKDWAYNDKFLDKVHDGLRARAPADQRAYVDAIKLPITTSPRAMASSSHSP